MELEELKAEIEDLHTKRQFSAIKTILNQLNPADIAQLLEEFSNEERLLFFRLLGKEEAADTFVELEPDNQEALIHAFSDNELREVLDELYHPDKINYATYGDGMPHVHVHIVPKYKGGVSWGQPFSDSLPKVLLTDAEYDAMIADLRAKLL